MKTAINRNRQYPLYSNPQTDAQLRDDFDALVMRASQGDQRAIGAIAIAFGPKLLAEAQAVMGDFAQEAADVLQDFFLSLLDGQSRFTPTYGRAIPWICGIVRAMARKHRADREREWEDGDWP